MTHIWHYLAMYGSAWTLLTLLHIKILEINDIIASMLAALIQLSLIIAFIWGLQGVLS